MPWVECFVCKGRGRRGFDDKEKGENVSRIDNCPFCKGTGEVFQNPDGTYRSGTRKK